MRGFAAAAWKPFLMLAVLAALGWSLRWAGLDGLVVQAGDHGPVVFSVVGSLACAIGLPRQVVAYTAGLAYGFWPGFALALLAEVVGCAVNFWVARFMGRNWAARFLSRETGAATRLARLERFLVTHAFSATLTIRLLPVGNNLALNLLAGVSRVRALPFIAASLLGYVPQTVVFALLGGGVRVSETFQLVLAALLLCASVGLGILLLRRRPIPA
ncbi:MAG: TVP38/TMEM64 family protein [Janthinobacterium lividum]